MQALETLHFWLVRRKKMSSQFQATTRNIDFSTSPKSNFGLVKRQKMTFKWHSATWIVALSNWKSRNFGCSRSKKWLQSDIRQLQSSLFRLHQNSIRLVHRPKICWECHSSHWNIAFSTSPNPHFGVVKRKKMSSQCLATTGNIAFSTSPKLNIGLFKR